MAIRRPLRVVITVDLPLARLAAKGYRKKWGHAPHVDDLEQTLMDAAEEALMKLVEMTAEGAKYAEKHS